ncbi:hypothetical protein T459_27374 [Capsicum annuum]|uniref:Cyclin-B1-2 n=1 Tax=Capsicum annuum TaxID=4072 RepID=A0A2G2YDR2_CAPAN|nr:hypothetical protein T459_27374 [Capsicum annuum]
MREFGQIVFIIYAVREGMREVSSMLKLNRRFQRPLAAIPSSMVGLESLTEGLEDFAFEDYLNDPKDSESFRPVDMHHGVEVHLGLSKGPVCASFI